MNYYHLFIYLFARGAKKVSKDQDDLFDRVFWAIGIISIFLLAPLLSISWKILSIQSTTMRLFVSWSILCILNYIYLKQGNRFERILDEYGKKNIRATALRDYIIALVVWFIVTCTIWLTWFIPH
jgi:hypothetical protein